jgi:hypothetical protein
VVNKSRRIFVDELNQTQTSGETEGQLPEQETAGGATLEETEAQEGVKGVVEGEKGAENKVSTPKTYTEDELQQRLTTTKGGYEGTIKKIQGDFSKLQQSYQEAAAKLEEAQNNSWLATIEAQGGNVDTAKMLVERAKSIATKEREINGLAAQLATMKAELDLAGLGKKANDLVAEYGLPKEAVETLATAQSVLEMENMALKMSFKKGAIQAKKPAKIDSGAGTGGGKVDLSKLSDLEKLGLALQGKIS